MSTTAQGQQALQDLVTEWEGVYRIGLGPSGRFYALRLDPFGHVSPAVVLRAESVPGLAEVLRLDYGTKVLHR